MEEHPFTTPKVPGSNPGKSLCNVMLHAIFFYLSMILAYGQSYFSYYINFRKYLKLTKVINQGGHPSNFPDPELQFFD